MKKNKVDATFEKLRENLEYRAEAALLDVAEALSRQIKATREARGLSQTDFAKLMDTKQPQVSRLEDPFCTRHSLLTLAKVADVLGGHLRVSIVDDSVNSFNMRTAANANWIAQQNSPNPRPASPGNALPKTISV